MCQQTTCFSIRVQIQKLKLLIQAIELQAVFSPKYIVRMPPNYYLRARTGLLRIVSLLETETTYLNLTGEPQTTNGEAVSEKVGSMEWFHS